MASVQKCHWRGNATEISTWSCSTCTLYNSLSKIYCDACGSARTDMPDIEVLVEIPVGNSKPVTSQDISNQSTGQKSTESDFIGFNLSEGFMVLDLDSNAKKYSTKFSRSVLREVDTTNARVVVEVPKNKMGRKKFPGTVGTKSKLLTLTEGDLVQTVTCVTNHKNGVENLNLNNQRAHCSSSSSAGVGFSKTGANSWWNCESCTLVNFIEAETCTACGQKKPTNSSDKIAARRRQSNDPRGPLKNAVKETFGEILSACEALQDQFVDDAFPPTLKSLYINGAFCTTSKRAYDQNSGQSAVAKWLRPQEIHSQDDMGMDWSITRNPVPSDIVQGRLGNCWFIGCLALIAERKELLEHIIQTKDINPAGAYILRLNKDGRWTDVIVDDLLPCDKNNRLIFSKGKRNQLWVPLIEKAMAKLHGCYESLVGGYPAESLMTFTGFPCETIQLFKPDVDTDMAWVTLLSSSSAGFLLGASTKHCTDEQEEQYFAMSGLVSCHVYSILKVNDQYGHRLLQLRNPWGHRCWTGDWSDKSRLWTRAMKLDLNPNQSKAGIFWICFGDFLKYFSTVDICKIRKDWTFHNFQGIFVPYAESEQHPCYTISVTETTEIDFTIYQNSGRDLKGIDKDWTPGDMSLLLFKASNLSSNKVSIKDSTLIHYTPRERKRMSYLNCILDVGVYYLIPVSFGHWTDNDATETFPGFEILIYSSRQINCSYSPPTPYLLADAMIKVGLKCCDRMQLGNDAVLYHNHSKQDFGRGALYVVENRSRERSISVELHNKTADNVFGTRDLKTLDCIPPRSRQVVNIVSLVNEHKSACLNISVRCTVNHKKDIGLTAFGLPIKNHSPELTVRNMGLHFPRQF